MPLVSILSAHYHRGLCRVSQKGSASGGGVYVEVTSDQIHPLLLPKKHCFQKTEDHYQCFCSSSSHRNKPHYIGGHMLSMLSCSLKSLLCSSCIMTGGRSPLFKRLTLISSYFFSYKKSLFTLRTK